MTPDDDDAGPLLTIAAEMSIAAAALIFTAATPDRWDEFTAFAARTAQSRRELDPALLDGLLSRNVATAIATRFVQVAEKALSRVPPEAAG